MKDVWDVELPRDVAEQNAAGQESPVNTHGTRASEHYTDAMTGEASRSPAPAAPTSQPDALAMLDHRPQDWREDFDLENGKYWNLCHKCGDRFIGHKRRGLCKECAAPTTPTPINYKWIVDWLIAEANTNPFCSIGHWVEHGRCADMLKEVMYQNREEERAEGYWEAKQMGTL